MRQVKSLALLSLFCFLLGCGEAGLDGAIRTTGKVTYKGAAVEGATVVFSPVGEGRAASGITDASGKFSLTSLTAGDGALAGKYNVFISKSTVGGRTDMTPDEARATLSDARPKVIAPQDALPVKYKNAAGGLTAEVTAGGSNDFPFDLQD